MPVWARKCRFWSFWSLLGHVLSAGLAPEGPAIEKIQSRLIAWNIQSIRLKVSIQDWKFLSRLKVSISLDNFNPDLDNSPQQERYFQSRLTISISIESFNLRLVAWKFQSRSEILNSFNLWALWGCLSADFGVLSAGFPKKKRKWWKKNGKRWNINFYPKDPAVLKILRRINSLSPY